MIVTLNGSSVNYKQGIVIHEKLTEDLDTGLLIIPQTTALTVEPMDEVTIVDSAESLSKYMLVSDIKRKVSRYEATKEYNYELGLVSPTIQLQRIVLPNRTITQPLTGSKTSIYTVLSRYVSMYSDFTISSALQTLTTSVDCPEFQWNRPTLYEVINDLLSTVDAVVTMTSFTEISYLDLNVGGSAITTNFTDEELTQNVQDFANKIECEAENAIVNSVNTRVVEWVAVKTDESVVLTTDNAKIILEHSIDKLNEVTCLHVSAPTTFQGTEADITSRVVEKTEYDLALTNNSLGYVSGNYKRDRLYYEYGGNVIDGLCYNEDTWLGTSTKKSVINVLYNAYFEQTGLTATLANTDIPEIFMKVDYQTQDTVKFISNKTQTYTNLINQDGNTLINNQDTSYVEFNSFAKKQQQTAFRLGNKILTGYKKYDGYSDMPTLGDTYETTFKLAEREYSLYDNFVNLRAVFSENYILKNLFTGLKTERRFQAIAKTNEALESNHIIESTFNLSRAADNQVSINSETLDTTLENYIFKFAEADEQITLIHFKSDSNLDIGVSPSAYWTEKSLILTYKMQDNFSAGLQIDDSTSNYLHNYVPYGSSTLGTFTSFVFKLYKGYDFTSEFPQVTYPAHKIRQLPQLDTSLLNSSDLVYTSGTVTRYKDNREITVETIQFNFTHDSNTIYGNKFFEDSPLTYASDTDTTLYVAYSLTETYEEGDQTKKGTIAAAGSLTYTKTNNDITISSPDSSITIGDLASWAICDSSGNIYVAVNL